MSTLRISDRRSLENIAREIGPVEPSVEELELRPEAGPNGRARASASLKGATVTPARVGSPSAEPEPGEAGVPGD